jgi:hypothetical protein
VALPSTAAPATSATSHDTLTIVFTIDSYLVFIQTANHNLRGGLGPARSASAHWSSALVAALPACARLTQLNSAANNYLLQNAYN